MEARDVWIIEWRDTAVIREGETTVFNVSLSSGLDRGEGRLLTGRLP
jgi:hypothetical protein